MSDQEDTLVCPYDRSHVVGKLRMAKHLVKCEESHPKIILSTCLYDFLHRVPPDELPEHLKICPSRLKFQTRFCIGEKPKGLEDDNVQNIFLKFSSSEKKDSAESKQHERPTSSKHSLIHTEDKGKGLITKFSTMRRGDYVKEESWDTDSSEEEKKGPSTSFHTIYGSPTSYATKKLKKKSKAKLNLKQVF